MISFFRRALSSWIVLGLLALIMIAFIVTGVGTPGSIADLGGGARGETIAVVGKQKLGASELTQRAQLALQSLQQEQKELTMAAFVAGGGVDDVATQLISARALEAWARKEGFDASKRLIDGEIASIPAFKGLNGKFDESIYRSMIAQRRLTDAQVRGDMAGDLIRRQLLGPVAGGTIAPKGVVTPYATLMLERRAGLVGIVPIQVIPPGAAPDEQAISSWYKTHLAAYQVPERRVIRYAVFGKDQLGVTATPSDAEIEAFYKANAADYGAKEVRSFSQVVLPDQAAAAAMVVKIKAGKSFADAAREAGFSATDTTLGVQTREQLSSIASPAIAAAAFAAGRGTVTEPLKSALGWHVLHVDSAKTSASRPLAAVKEEIAASLEKRKTAEAIADLVAKIEGRIDDGASFEDVAKAYKLSVVATPPVLSSGQAPDSPDWIAPPEFAPLLKAAFEGGVDDDPTVETIGDGSLHALMKIDSILPAAPAPLAKVRERIAADVMRDRASQRAKAIAQSIVSKANAGVDFRTAIGEAGIALPPPQPADARQIDIMRSGQQAPPPLAMMFSMKAGTSKLLEIPGGQGWYIVHLDAIEKGDIAAAPGLIEATRGEFRNVITQELAQQFAKSVEKQIGVKRHDDTIAKVKAQLIGNGGQ